MRFHIKRRTFLDRIAATGGTGTIKEKKPWVDGTTRLADAERDGVRLPIIFSDSAYESALIYWAILTDVAYEPAEPEFGRNGSTTYSFTELKRISPPRRLDELTLWNKGKPRPLSLRYQRNYAICLTPDFL